MILRHVWRGDTHGARLYELRPHAVPCAMRRGAAGAVRAQPGRAAGSAASIFLGVGRVNTFFGQTFPRSASPLFQDIGLHFSLSVARWTSAPDGCTRRATASSLWPVSGVIPRQRSLSVAAAVSSPSVGGLVAANSLNQGRSRIKPMVHGLDGCWSCRNPHDH